MNGAERAGPTDGQADGPGRTTPTATDRSVVSGVLWTVGAKWGAQAIRWVSTIVVARLLSPQDYGLVAMGSVLIGLVQYVSEMGLSTAVVRERNLSDDQVAQLGGLSVLLGLGFFVLTAALAYPMALFYDEPALTAIVLALSTTFLVRGFQVMPRALMMRGFRFRALAGIDMLDGAVLGVVTLVAALLGMRYWSLVIGNLASAIAMAIAFRVASPERLLFFAPLSRVRTQLTLGWHIVVTRIAWYAYSNADMVIIGRTLGSGVLGAYSFGWTLASIPVERVSAVLNRVAYAAFAEVQEDVVALRRFFCSFAEAVAMLTLPGAIGLALVADLFVPVVLGPHWGGAVWPLRLLCLATPLRSLVPLVSQMLVTVGYARENRNQNVIAAIAMPILFLIGSRWGAPGVAAAWVVGYPVVVFPNIRLVFRHLALSWREVVSVLWPAVSSSAIMMAAVVASRLLTPASLHDAVELTIAVVVGLVSFGLATFAMHRDRIKALLAVIRRPSPAASAAASGPESLPDAAAEGSEATPHLP